MKNRVWIAGLLACFGTATATMAADGAGRASGVGGATAQAFRAAHPGAQFYLTGSRITSVYGEAFAQGTSAVDSAERFLATNARMLGVETAELTPGSLAGDGAAVREFFPDGNGGSKFTLVSYLQHKDGIPVFKGNVRLLVRNEAGSPLVLVRSGLKPLGDFVPDQAVAAAPNVGAALADAMLRFPGMQNFTAAEVVIWAGVDSMEVQPRLAVVYTGEAGDVSDPSTYQKQLIVSDAATGQMLWSEDQVSHVNVTGSVKYNATNSYRAGVCDPEVLMPMPYARVTVGATSYYADVNGNFTITNSGTTAITVQSMVRGRYFQVLNSAGAESTLSLNVTPPGPADFVHNSANNTELQLAEVNAYRHANVVRDHLLQFSPGFPTIAGQTNFTANVMVSGTCNAFYNGSSINFYPTGGGCNNTSFGTVVHHEYGHHIVSMAGSGQGQYGEGFGDLMGQIITDDPVTGRGFSSCSGGIRSGNNSIQYPCSGEIHDCGQLITGCFWSTRNALLVTNPSDYRDIISHLATNSVLLHDGTEITPQITIDVLTLDDNNGNIADGTPHYAQIATGFGAHNMDAPPLIILTYNYPAGRPVRVDPAGGTAFQVQIAGSGGNVLNNSSAKLYIDPENDGSYAQYPLQNVGGSLFNVNFPATTCGSALRYYLSAATTTGTVVTSPEGAPAAAYSTVSATALSTAFSDNFETATGWTTAYAGGVATGTWVRGTPGNWGHGDPTADFDGSGQCYVTGNADGSNPGTGGTATLTSPTLNASGGDYQIAYARWFYCDGTNDTFVVEASNNNGTTWVPIELLSAAQGTGGWVAKNIRLADFLPLTATMKVRFKISDVSPASVVEGGVDAVALRILECPNNCPADFDGDGFVTGADFDAYVAAFDGGDQAADFDGDGFVTGADFDAYVVAYEAGCN